MPVPMGVVMDGPTELLDCAWCGLPLEAVGTWTYVHPATSTGPERIEIEMVSARCLDGHWYGGPLDDVRRHAVG